jgi:hypothetical protein
MNIHILVGQRKAAFAGEYATEVIAAIDENGADENPEFLLNALEENRPEFEAITIVVVQVSNAEIDKRLHPAFKPIEGTVIDD